MSDELRDLVNDHMNSTLDFYKTSTDVNKHLMTLSSGVLVFVASFREKFAPNPAAKIAISAALVSFLLCIGCAAHALFRTVGVSSGMTSLKSHLLAGTLPHTPLDELRKRYRKIEKGFRIAMSLSYLFFVLGLGIVTLITVLSLLV